MVYLLSCEGNESASHVGMMQVGMAVVDDSVVLEKIKDVLIRKIMLLTLSKFFLDKADPSRADEVF